MAGSKGQDFEASFGSRATSLRESAEGERPLLSEEDQVGEERPKADGGNENSPLLEPRKSDEEALLEDPVEGQHSSHGQCKIYNESKSTWYLFILTLSIGGLQIAWATELSNGSPFLLSLGLDKALLAFVWIAGPLMGVLVQPYIGILSDRSRIPWGKRRPFILGGAAGTIISLLALAWTKNIVGGVLSFFGVNPDSKGVQVTSIVFAVVWVYILDFAVNAVQAAIRAFIVDNAPTHQQEDANAWAGRLTGFGNILGYFSGSANLPKYFPFLGDTQFKILCVFSAIALSSTVLVSCICINERDPQEEERPPTSKLGVVSFFRQTFVALIRLPPQIRKICEVQFFNWIGWFPFLFYITTYIGQLEVNPIFEEHPGLPAAEIDKYWTQATETGSFALLIYAITSFTASIILPILIVPSYTANPDLDSESNPEIAKSVWFLAKFRIPHLTLRRAWLYSHILFALCMISTFVISSPKGGFVMTGFVGISWALTMWAPFALIAAEISKNEALKRSRKTSRPQRSIQHGRDTCPPVTGGLDGLDGPDSGHDQAGVVLGLHNVAVSAPQILASLISSGIFKIAQKQRGVAGDDSVGWVLRFGGLAALVAAGMTWRIKEREEEGTRPHQESEQGM